MLDQTCRFRAPAERRKERDREASEVWTASWPGVSTIHCVEQDQLRSIFARQGNCKRDSCDRFKTEIGGIEDSLQLHRHISMRRDGGTDCQDGTGCLLKNLFCDRTEGGCRKTSFGRWCWRRVDQPASRRMIAERVGHTSPLRRNHFVGHITKLLSKNPPWPGSGNPPLALFGTVARIPQPLRRPAA